MKQKKDLSTENENKNISADMKKTSNYIRLGWTLMLHETKKPFRSLQILNIVFCSRFEHSFYVKSMENLC